MEGGKLTHSHSQPGGMDRTPPGTPKKGGKMLAVRVQMLDDSITMFQVQAKALGRVLFDQVCKQLHLLESDYFGLEYQEIGGTKYWLDLEKPLSRQIGLSLIDTLVRFCVKFYTPDPSQLEEEFTRYLFCLQIKRDLAQGLLQCNDNTAALMASYIVQAECGDYVVEDYPDHRYLSSYKFVPNQDHDLERRIMENHKKHAGQSPAEADLNLLETARRCELYGIKMHPAKDHEGVPLNLAVAHMGIVVFQNYTKINTFSWAKIRKISFKRKRFLVKLHPEGYGYYKDTVDFFFEGRNECKNFWKKCVENHGFFRCSMVKRVPRQKTRVISRGSSFRYSGRTQKQIVEFVRENYVKRATFQRSQSFRHSNSAHSSVANVGTSISAHPLLPLGDNAVAGTPASLSCGSMTLTSSPLHTADIHAGGSPSPPLTTSASPVTSVTSSPQHFYPQETPYRRTDFGSTRKMPQFGSFKRFRTSSNNGDPNGHQPTRLKHPHAQSLHTTSSLQSPSSAATAVSNLSANHTNNNSNSNNNKTISNNMNNNHNNINNDKNNAGSNNNNVIMNNNDMKNSRMNLKSPDYQSYNDIYSNCYASLGNLRNEYENIDTIDDNSNETKPDISTESKSLSNIKSSEYSMPVKPSDKVLDENDDDDDDDDDGRYTWHRSASCKDLYRAATQNTSAIPDNVQETSCKVKQDDLMKEDTFQVGYDSPITRYDDTIPLYATVDKKKSKKNQQDKEIILNTKIYSSSFPGTTSSLSTEEGEQLSDRIVEVIDMSGSQEEIGLSHDDISHDSYELLERDFDDYDNSVEESTRSKGRRIVSESDRTRSCSWGSDRGTSPMDSRDFEKGIEAKKSRENGFRSLERGKSPKHKSEIDFRSLDRKSPKYYDDRLEHRTSKSYQKLTSGERKQESAARRRSREYLEYESRHYVPETCGRCKEVDDDVFRTQERISPLDSQIFSPKVNEDDAYRSIDRESRIRKRSKEYDPDGFNSYDRKRSQDRRRSREELEIFAMDSEEEYMKEEQRRAEEKKRMERKRDKWEREERFHEGLKEREEKEEKERRYNERRKSMEEERMERKKRMEEEERRRPVSDLTEESYAKKYERVVSNQFGRYSEFLVKECDHDLMMQERKVLENYEKVCQVGRIAKEMERNERGLSYPDVTPLEAKNPAFAQSYKLLTDLNQQPKVKPDSRMKISDVAEAKISKPEPDVVKTQVQVSQFKEFNAKTKGGIVLGFTASPKGSPKLGKAPIERTKSDPYDTSKNLRRNVLTHQKSIDLTPQDSGEATSDYDNDSGIRVTSRSDHDIPYVLHKRHCMNGTAKDHPTVASRNQSPAGSSEKKPKSGEVKAVGKPRVEKSATGRLDAEEHKPARFSPVSPKMTDPRKGTIEIINLDAGSINIVESKKVQRPKPAVAKKPTLPKNGKSSSPKNVPKSESAKKEAVPRTLDVEKDLKKNVETAERPKQMKPSDIAKEPIYATVNKVTKAIEIEPVQSGKRTPTKKVPPEPPKRISSTLKSPQPPDEEPVEPKPPERTSSLMKSPTTPGAKKVPPEPPKRTTSAQKLNAEKDSDATDETVAVVPSVTPDLTSASGDVSLNLDRSAGKSISEDSKKSSVTSTPSKGKTDFSLSNLVPHKREESLILFARTRLGLSEGSAFTPVMRQVRVGSPVSQRRTKSLDAPVVNVHSLPPADAFSSKDDTLDGGEDVVVQSLAAKAAEFFNVDLKKVSDDGTSNKTALETTISTESEMDAFLPDDLDIETNFKETVESQSKVELTFPEEKVLDSVRSKRLLSKIDSVDAINSDGDLDSSRHAEAIPIPADRLVNLPESVRFPSVRQISGQTSEESADGWDPKEVKVKRRTPRRSVGREEPDTGILESVVWDSKDEEQPDDEVWDDNMVFRGKADGTATITDAVVSNEYLKRGSCGQSIDDDNLSTPMKESSPEHWVSVDDLPEALEREERLLREQEKILREKILNEKLKRELNLDTIDIEEKLYDSYRSSIEEVPLPILPKEKFKGHSLDTYELTEKKVREKCTNKNPSLDEHIFKQDSIKTYLAITSTLDISDKSSSYENVPKISKFEKGRDFKCKVVNDVNEIDQFGDNDEDLEEFVVVLDENLGSGKNSIWDDDITYSRTVSKEESLISVPEEFKDVEEEAEELVREPTEAPIRGKVEIRLDNESRSRKDDLKPFGEKGTDSEVLEEKLQSVYTDKATSEDPRFLSEDTGRLSPYDSSRRSSEDPRRLSTSDDYGRLSPYDGSRRGSEDHRRLSASDDTGRLSPYDYSSRRSSDDPRRLSASEDTGRLSPFDDSRRGSEDPRHLSTSEDSRRYSASEDSRRFSTSVSEETRRRLSSTEETRRKRASLTKQCSVGVDSLSDDMIPGIQECSSSFEQDEKDVFESNVVAETETVENEKTPDLIPEVDKGARDSSNPQVGGDSKEGKETPVRKLEIEVSEECSEEHDHESNALSQHDEPTENDSNHLAPPKSERELSRETEDSVDYGEGDFKEIRDAVKEKDISEGLICDNEPIKTETTTKAAASSFEKSESSDADELRFIDDKRGNTPEMIVGKGKETAAVTMVVVNEGISVLNKILEKDRVMKSQSLPRDALSGASGTAVDQRHTLPKAKLPEGENAHRKLTKISKNAPIPGTVSSLMYHSGYLDAGNMHENSQDSSQESEADRLSEVSMLAQVQSQISRRNLSDTGKRLKVDGFATLEKSRSKTSAFKNHAESTPVVRISEVAKGAKDTKKGEGVQKEAAEGLKAEKTGDKEKKSPDHEKRDSGEDVSSSSSAPPHPKKELSSTWRPFLLESSGSSSLEEGWLPHDDNAHLADEEETSSTSNNQQDDSFHDDVIDYPSSVGYPVLNISSAEMIVGGYGSVFSLSRTLSRISERSTTSEQEKSDVEDDITKPSSHSVSIEEESIMSSDHQPSLSSDPPSPKASTSKIPDLPDDRSPIPGNFLIPEDKTPTCEPFTDDIPPPLPDDDWPSPPTSSSMFDTPVVSHIETFYLEIHPEEAYKVVVKEPHVDENSSSDENHTLHEEGEFLHLSSDNLSVSTTTTTQDGTVIVPIRPRNLRTNSVSEDTSVISTSEWSNSTAIRPKTNSNLGTTEDLSDWTRTLQDGSSSGKLHSKHGTMTSEDASDWSSSAHRKQNLSGFSASDEILSDNLGSRSEWSLKSGDTSQGTTISDWSSSAASKFRSEGGSERSYPEKYYESPKSKKTKPPKLTSPTGKNIGFFETPISKVRSPTSQAKFFEKSEKTFVSHAPLRSPTSYSETNIAKAHGRSTSGSYPSRSTDYYDIAKTRSPTKHGGRQFESSKGGEHSRKTTCTPYYSNVTEIAEKSYFGRYDTGSLERSRIHRKCFSYYSVARSPPSDDDSSSNEAAPPPASNTIPRASKRSKKRHRVAMDLQICDGKIVAPPKTRTTVVDNSDSDRSSPRANRYSPKKQSDV